LDFEKGTETILADSVPMNWYRYDNFAFSDDETKIAFSFFKFNGMAAMTKLIKCIFLSKKAPCDTSH
jgi:hypothetical protein